MLTIIDNTLIDIKDISFMNIVLKHNKYNGPFASVIVHFKNNDTVELYKTKGEWSFKDDLEKQAEYDKELAAKMLPLFNKIILQIHNNGADIPREFLDEIIKGESHETD